MDREAQMNFILHSCERMPYQTDVAVILASFGGRQNEYNWLITDIELNQYPEEFIDKEIIWISGEKLTELLNKFKTQFIWGVLSGFRKDTTLDVNNLEVIPSTHVNTPEIQHPLASVEIVCFDSTFTLLLSKDKEISNRFSDFFGKDATPYKGL